MKFHHCWPLPCKKSSWPAPGKIPSDTHGEGPLTLLATRCHSHLFSINNRPSSDVRTKQQDHAFASHQAHKDGTRPHSLHALVSGPCSRTLELSAAHTTDERATRAHAHADRALLALLLHRSGLQVQDAACVAIKGRWECVTGAEFFTPRKADQSAAALGAAPLNEDTAVRSFYFQEIC